MKLDAKVLRYMSPEDFRVLVAVGANFALDLDLHLLPRPLDSSFLAFSTIHMDLEAILLS